MAIKIKAGKQEFKLRFPKGKLESGRLTREVFREILAEELKASGYELIDITFTTLGTYISIKEPDGLYTLSCAPEFPEEGIEVHSSKNI